jgi:hypothetical protein
MGANERNFYQKCRIKNVLEVDWAFQFLDGEGWGKNILELLKE